jgi:hypothetical protein
MNLEERLHKALRTPNPGQALRLVVLDLSQEGRNREEIYHLFEQFLVRSRARTDFREADEEVLLDTLDALTGWCHPEARLLPGDETAAGTAPPG